jgi:hypothetical protein
MIFKLLLAQWGIRPQKKTPAIRRIAAVEAGVVFGEAAAVAVGGDAGDCAN